MALTIPELSEDEKKELELLKEEHENLIQNTKHQVFKSLPPHLRESVINSRKIQESSEAYYVEPEKCDRLKELESTKEIFEACQGWSVSGNNYYGGGKMKRCESDYWDRTRSFPDISIEKLEELHTDVVIEEEVFETKED